MHTSRTKKQLGKSDVVVGCHGDSALPPICVPSERDLLVARGECDFAQLLSERCCVNGAKSCSKFCLLVSGEALDGSKRGTHCGDPSLGVCRDLSGKNCRRITQPPLATKVRRLALLLFFAWPREAVGGVEISTHPLDPELDAKHRGDEPNCRDDIPAL